MEVGLSPGDIVLDGDPAPLTERSTAVPFFGSCLLTLSKATNKIVSDIFAHLTAEYRRAMDILEHVLSAKNCSFAYGDLD